MGEIRCYGGRRCDGEQVGIGQLCFILPVTSELNDRASSYAALPR